MKRAGRKAAVWLAAMLAFSGCGEFLDASIGEDSSREAVLSASVDAGFYEITANDYLTQSEGAGVIELDRLTALGREEFLSADQSPAAERVLSAEAAASALPEGCLWDGQSLIISSGGDYLLRGRLEGSVILRAYNDEVVHLILENAEIQAVSGPAIYVEKAAKAILTAADGTQNVVSDTVNYEQENQACIFSNVDLTINGSGALSVYGYYEDGVRSKDLLKVICTNLFVKSSNDGLRGNDGVIVFESGAEIQSKGTGIRSVSEKDMVMIQGGSCKVTAGKCAVEANCHVSIHESQADLHSLEEKVKCSGVLDIQEDILS